MNGLEPSTFCMARSPRWGGLEATGDDKPCPDGGSARAVVGAAPVAAVEAKKEAKTLTRSRQATRRRSNRPSR